MISAILGSIAAVLPAIASMTAVLFLMNTNKKLEDELRQSHQENIELLMIIEGLHRADKYNASRVVKRANQASPEVIEAVKFAMMQAHPDNPNGDHDKFIKYRKLYEQLKECG